MPVGALAAAMGRIILAICGLVLALGTGALSLSEPPEKGVRKEKSEVQAEVPAPSAASAPPLKPNINAPPCKQPQDRNACDLEAQWKAADAARDAADLSLWQLLISAGGLLGLLYSLLLTRRATRVAVEATEDAESALKFAAASARAAERMAEVTSEHGKLQIEAGLRFERAMVTVVPNEIWVAATIKNVRPTAAINVTGSATFIFAFPDQPPVSETVLVDLETTELHEGADTVFHAKWLDLDEGMREQLRTSSSFETRIDYCWETVFSERLGRSVFLKPRQQAPFAFPDPTPGANISIQLVQINTTATRTKLDG